MIPFIEKTWFLWWILVTVVFLRWFHLISCHSDETALEAPYEERPATASKEIPSGTASRHFAQERAYAGPPDAELVSRVGLCPRR